VSLDPGTDVSSLFQICINNYRPVESLIIRMILGAKRPGGLRAHKEKSLRGDRCAEDIRTQAGVLAAR
jgi:hypothetical protein